MSGNEPNVPSGSQAVAENPMVRHYVEKLVEENPFMAALPPDTLIGLIQEMFALEKRRERLAQYNSVQDVVRLIANANKIVVVAGAGLSVSCGIPDFRSENGIYAQLKEEWPELPEPQAMFDIRFFRDNPRPFYKFARQIYPGTFTPSIAHYFVRELERKGKLLRFYTQNIDTLERQCGVERVVECHGSFHSATCLTCRKAYTKEDIRVDVIAGTVPRCMDCMRLLEAKRQRQAQQGPGDSSSEDDSDESYGLIKPDIVFFGEQLPAVFKENVERDAADCDLLLVMGSSMQVRPVSMLPKLCPENVPQVLINREPLKTSQQDVHLLGLCDDIAIILAKQLGWLEGMFGQPDVGHDVPEWIKQDGYLTEIKDGDTTCSEDLNAGQFFSLNEFTHVFRKGVVPAVRSNIERNNMELDDIGETQGNSL